MRTDEILNDVNEIAEQSEVIVLVGVVPKADYNEIHVIGYDSSGQSLPADKYDKRFEFALMNALLSVRRSRPKRPSYSQRVLNWLRK